MFDFFFTFFFRMFMKFSFSRLHLINCLQIIISNTSNSLQIDVHEKCSVGPVRPGPPARPAGPARRPGPPARPGPTARSGPGQRAGPRAPGSWPGPRTQGSGPRPRALASGPRARTQGPGPWGPLPPVLGASGPGDLGAHIPKKINEPLCHHKSSVCFISFSSNCVTNIM